MRLSAAYQAFRRPALISDPLENILNTDDFNKWEHRRLRYSMYWAFYENTLYTDDLHKWATRFKIEEGFYKYIRSIYNPAYRLGEFWKSHLWGGELEEDPDKQKDSALPIDTEQDGLIEAIYEIWQWSNWGINKDVVTLYGSIFGDVALQVVDDIEKEKAYLRVVHPGTIKDIDIDDFGNVKGYIIEENRPNPFNPSQVATYTEIAERGNGEEVVYRTLLNNAPYAWDGQAAEWSVNYGFIPMVVIQHNNVGLDWGWSEIHPMRAKFNEVDDQASKISDHIRKAVHPKFFVAGASKPAETPTAAETSLTGTAALNRPQPGREEIDLIYGPESSSITPMIYNLGIVDAISHLKEMLANLEEELPELRKGIMTTTGEASGRALRVARQPVETKVNQRRASYDDALVRANQMAVAIAGERGYIQGFNLSSFEAGALDHRIGRRPVFAQDPMDDIEVMRAKFEALKILKEAGADPIQAAIEVGYTEEEAKKLMKQPEPAPMIAPPGQPGQLGQMGNPAGMDEPPGERVNGQEGTMRDGTGARA